jgi:nucleoside-diphosphate-sugar epimerase
MRVLLTGVTGFIGSHLAERLMARGDSVSAIIRPSSDVAALAARFPKLALHVHDGTTEGMHALVREANPDAVVHLASMFRAEHRPDEVASLVESNVLFPTQLLDALTAHAVKFFVNTGTSWQHYETDAYRPVCLYAATKQAFEDLLAFYVDAGSLRAVTLKLFDTYGPGDRRKKLFHWLQHASEAKEPLAMSPGDQQIDAVFIDDVVAAFEAALKYVLAMQESSYEAFAVSSTMPISLRDLAAVFEKMAGRTLQIQWGGRPYRCREVMRTSTTISLVPGWRPEVTLEEGIGRMLEQAKES